MTRDDFWEYKRKVLKAFPDAYCVRLDDKTGFIVWPGPIRPRGFEQCAIGFGTSAKKAWESVKWVSVKP